jgi:hypothetical protein
MQVIYRKSDRAVAGWCESAAAVNQEIANICASELGGTASDYAVAVTDADRPDGTVPVVGSDLAASYAEPTKVSTKRTNTASGKTKLQNLGLTADEVSALFS